MGCEGCAPCANCPHGAKWHRPVDNYRCMGSVRRWIDRPTGPPWPVTSPCSCTGYQPKEIEVTTPPAGDTPAQALSGDIAQVTQAVDQVAAGHGANPEADAAAAAEIVPAAVQAYGTLRAALQMAHNKWMLAIADAHAEYIRVMTHLHGQAPASGPGAGNGGAQ